jgi:hypothetical protein
MHLSISLLSDLTGRDRRRITKQLNLQYTAGRRAGRDGVRISRGVAAPSMPWDNIEAARAEQARSAAQLNAIRAEDLRKTRIPMTIVLRVHDEIFQAIAATLKSVFAKSGVWVRIPSSAPSKSLI